MAIAWACHGKAIAKAQRTNLALLGNRLDTLTRNAQDGQTVGLPVGPDTSRVIAELLASSLDQHIHLRGDVPKGDLIRFVDDFVAGCNNMTDGERILTLIRGGLRSVELEMNETKTAIRSSHELSYESWRHDLRSRVPPAMATRQQFEIYFDFVYGLADRHPEANVCAYAIKLGSNSFSTSLDAWPIIENFLLISYRREPAVLPSVIGIIVDRQRAQLPIDLRKIQDFTHSSVERLVAIGLYGELLWFLFLCLRLRISLRANEIEKLFEEEEPLAALMLCHLQSEGLLVGNIDKSAWDSFANPDGLKSAMWPYAYEAPVKGWSGVGKQFIVNDAYFSELLSRRISFYDPLGQVASVRRLRAQAISASRRQRAILEDFLEDFDFDIDDLDLVDLEPEDLDELY